MGIRELKAEFESRIPVCVYESTRLTFLGADGYDVYNCSIPFTRNGKEYIYGRVEKRDEWATSMVYLFQKTASDTYERVYDHMRYQLEDPFISMIGDEIVLGGTHVRKKQGGIDSFYGYFYRGTDLEHLAYFTTGPERMKDIRLVELADKKIGVFSRPCSEEILKKYGSKAVIGFTVINSLDELNDAIIESAPPIEGLFDDQEWGGCNQAYLLQNGWIGVIGHQSYETEVSSWGDDCQTQDKKKLSVYLSIAFEFDPTSRKVSNKKVIGTRRCYSDYPCKLPYLADCTFTSGIVMRDDGKVDLYGGIGDTAEGRIVIEYPFSQPFATEKI